MYCYIFIIYMVQTIMIESRQLHNKLEVPSVKPFFLTDKLNQFSDIFTPWYRRWVKPVLRQNANLTEYLEQKKREKKKETYTYVGPPRNKYYDPSYGYEPYWADGDWVMDWYHKLQPKRNETVCDEKCVEMHYRFGKVCGRNKRLETKTFDNMCAMRHFDCLDDHGWVPIYRGECRPEIKYMTYVRSSTITPMPLKSMAPIYIQDFEDRHPYLQFLDKKSG